MVLCLSDLLERKLVSVVKVWAPREMVEPGGREGISLVPGFMASCLILSRRLGSHTCRCSFTT
jgi:hypothetical protein